MMLLFRSLIVIGLEAALAYFAFFLVERTFEGALKAIKLALKFEFTTDAGKMNFIGVVVLTFLTIFFSLHEALADVLSIEKHPPSDARILAPLILFGLVFIGSMICVLLMGRPRHPNQPEN